MTKTEKILSNHGIRPTQMRSKIYKFLKRKQSAVTLREMQKIFVIKSEVDKTADKTTFYRAIKLFEEKPYGSLYHFGKPNKNQSEGYEVMAYDLMPFYD